MERMCRLSATHKNLLWFDRDSRKKGSLGSSSRHPIIDLQANIKLPYRPWLTVLVVGAGHRFVDTR